MKKNKATYQDFFKKAQTTKAKNVPLGSHKKVVMRNAKLKINYRVLGIVFPTFLGALWAFIYFDDLDSLWSRVHLGFGNRALAESGSTAAKKEETPANSTVDSNKKDIGGDEKTSESSSPSDSQSVVDSNTGASEESSKKKEGESEGAKANSRQANDTELNHFARLRERKLELDQREKEIERMEQEVLKQREELEKKIAEIEKMRKTISALLEEKVQADDQKVDNLVQFYSSMKPQQAARILETIDEGLAVKILSKMKKNVAAEIMNLLKSEKAQVISEKYAGYRK